MKPARSCPICPNCGSKKFKRLQDNSVKVMCTSCKKVLSI